MSSASLSINISPEQLASLQNVPGQIQTLVQTATQLLQSVRDGSNETDPVSVMFQSLSSIGGEAQQLPSIDSLLEPIRGVVGSLPSGTLADISAIGSSIESVLSILGPAKDALISGNIEEVFEDGLARALDAAGRLFQENDEIRTLHRELEQFFRLFRAMVEWRTNAPRPEDVVDLLSRALAGIPPDLLEAPFTALEGALAPLSGLLPDGPDLSTWRGTAGLKLQFWQGIEARFSGGAAINWPNLEADLQAEFRLMLQLREVRDRLIASTLSDLGSLRLDGLAGVVSAIQAVPRIQPFKMTPILDGFRLQLQGIAADLETWNPTEEEVRAMVRATVERLLAFLADSPLGRLRTMLIEFQQRILHAIESLPFRDIARMAENALREVAGAVDVLDPEAIRQPIREFFQQIEDKLNEISGDTVRNAIGSLWQGVEDALNQVTEQIETLRATLEGLVSQLQSVVENAQPALEAISESVLTIKTTLEGFDLSEPAAEVIGVLNELRDTVATLDVSMLPAPAVSLLKSGAELLRGIDVAAAITPPIDETLSEIDPTPLLEEAGASLSVVFDRLSIVDPAALTARLDEPVDQLLAALSDFGPDRLRSLIEAALQPVEDAINSLDFGELLAPITRLYAELSAKVDAVLNPDPIFQPIEDLFKPVVDAIDRLEPSKVLDLLSPHAGSFAEKAGSGAGPPSVITEAGGTLRETLQPGPESEDPLFGFRPGDMLVPLIDLHRLLMQAFDALDDAILEPAGRMLQSALRGRLDSFAPPAVQLRVRSRLEAVRLEFDSAAVSTALKDGALAYRSAAGRIASAAKQTLSPADAAIATRVLALLPELDPKGLAPAPSQGEAIASASIGAEARLDLSGLRASVGSLDRLGELIPGFLSGAELGAGSLRQALRELDPAPIRDEINALFDQVGQKIVAVESKLIAGLEEFFLAVEDFFLPVTPAALVQLANKLHAALKQQILSLHPSVLKDEVKLIFDVVKRQLTVLDPSVIVEELNGLRDALVQRLRDLVVSLLPDPAPFQALLDRLATLRPSQLLAPVVESLQPVTELIATINPAALLEPLIEAIARIREQIPQVIADIEAAFDDVLAAFPEGGATGATVSVSAEASI